jgi:hypothetical protein
MLLPLTGVGARGILREGSDLSSSSDEGDLIADVSRDEEFARKLFGDLNHNFLGPPSDGRIIILSDSNKEKEEVCEKKASDVEAAEAASSSAVRSLTPTASADDADKGDTPDRVIGGSSSSEDETGLP